MAKMTRRTFFGGLAAAGAACGLKAQGVEAKLRIDKNLSVFFSDVHVDGRKDGSKYQGVKFRETVAEVLKLDPLPGNAFIFGDFSFLWGLHEDYVLGKELLKPLVDAGVKVTIGMGNHDRRSTFLKEFPEYEGRTAIPGRIVTVTDAGGVDLIMLDGLQGTDNRGDRDMGPVPGKLDKAQQEWLADGLAKRTKPFIVCSHFPSSEMKIGEKDSIQKMLCGLDKACGYVHGHDHFWRVTPLNDWRNGQIKTQLCLPSTGHWGDIGYTLFKVDGGEATAEIKLRDVYFPGPNSRNEKNGPHWDAHRRQTEGQKCCFAIPRRG